MKAKPQKHWTNEAQILRAIEKTHQTQRDLCERGEQLKRDAAHFARLAADPKTSPFQKGHLENSSRAALAEAELAFQRASRMDGRLYNLKRTHAAFRTEIIPGITMDKSVVTQ